MSGTGPGHETYNLPMQLLTLGLNHQTAPLALRERLAFVPTEVAAPSPNCAATSARAMPAA